MLELSRNIRAKLTSSRNCIVIAFLCAGAESPEAVRKLMSLSDKVRPHNSKANPLPPKSVLSLATAKSPHVGRRPASPRQQRPAPAVAVSLSAEDSSVVSSAASVPASKKLNVNKQSEYVVSSAAPYPTRSPRSLTNSVA